MRHSTGFTMQFSNGDLTPKEARRAGTLNVPSRTNFRTFCAGEHSPHNRNVWLVGKTITGDARTSIARIRGMMCTNVAIDRPQ